MGSLPSESSDMLEWPPEASFAEFDMILQNTWLSG